MNFIRYTSSLLAILLLSSIGLVSQSIDVERVITDDYPTMTAEFRVFDGSNTEVRNLNAGNFTVTENGEEVDINAMFCDDNTRFSLIFVFDASQSMEKEVSDEQNAPSRISVMRNVAEDFIENLPDGQFEASIMKFSGYPTILKEFTDKKDELIKELKFPLEFPTNYNKAFFGDANHNGAFHLVDQAIYKPFILFLTDGEHDENYGVFESDEVTSTANEKDAVIYTIALGTDINNENDLSSISTSTGGKFFQENLSEEQLNDTYNEILQAAKGFGTPAPCSFEFETNCGGGDIEVTYNGFDPAVSDQHQYDIPSSVKPHLDIQAREFLELNPPVGQETTIDVVLTAEKNDLEITGYNSTLAEFTVTDWGGSAPPFTIAQGGSRTIKVAVNPSTRECLTDGQLTFEGTACTGNLMNPKAGFIFAEDINLGNVNQGESKRDTYTKRFCNYTDSEINITTIRVSGGPHEDDFSIPLQGNQTVGECECIDIEAEFEPTDQGEREAEYTVVTYRGDFKAKLLGGGSGLPSIAANDVPFQAVNCTDPTASNVVEIVNDGPVALEVTAVSLSDNSNFTYTGPQTFTVPANSTDNTTATVEFNPQSDGAHSTTMTIESNAENDQEYELNLDGEMLAIDYETSRMDYDFGELCATDTPIQVDIDLSNNNNFGYEVAASSDNSAFTTDQGSYSLSSSGSNTVTITFEATDNNTYNGTITFESECGNKIVEVNVSGTINNPQVVDDSQSINAVVGDNDTQTIQVENPNADEFDVVDAFVGDAGGNPIGEFIVTPTSFTVPGNGSFPVDITYTPNPNEPVAKSGSLYLIVEAPCEVEITNIKIDGNPSLAVADLNVPEGNSDYIGNTTTIPVTLKAGAGFEQSGTESITFDLEFNNTILSPISGTQVSSNADTDVYRYEHTLTSQLSENDPPVTIPLQFEVLNGLPLDITDLNVVDSKAFNSSGEESAQLNTSDGDFTIILADGEVQIEELSAEPGEEFTIPIFIHDEDDDLDEALHEELLVKLRYNFTVMEPLDLPFTIIGGDQAEIDITDKLKFVEGKKGNKVQAQLAFAEIPMRAKLGNQEVSNIVVDTVQVLSGGVAEFTKSVSVFNLLGVCKDDGKVRLYSPNNIEPGVFVESSLVRNNTSMYYTVIENGQHSVKLYDITGNVVETFVDANHSQVGTFEEEIDPNDLRSGSYILRYQTPTQVFTLKLVIVK